MIDLIIPYYNNPEGIIRTLQSINFNIFHVTIIDDHSDIYLPHNIFGAQVFRYNNNRGPGCARQWGIDHTSNSYIMFLDTGDIFISQEIQEQIANLIKENSEVEMFIWSYYRKGKLAQHTDNRVHGKVYKRSFLNQYHITFSEKGSYMNEDIGFNRACRAILKDKIYYIDTPVIQWILDENSITEKNDKVIIYKDQTRALAINSIHTINILTQNSIDPQEEINQIASSLYYWFLFTTANRKQYIQDAWDGARIFYKQFENQIRPNQLIIGNASIKRCLAFKDKVSFPINILRFTNEILNNEIIPSYYLT